MKLVFRLGEVGVSLPVDHLVEIRQGSAAWIDQEAAEPARGLIGYIPQREDRLPVFDLYWQFGLSRASLQESITFLVLTGREGSRGGIVDRIDGIYAADEFKPVAAPPLLTRRIPATYRGFDLWREELLIAGDVALWELTP